MVKLEAGMLFGVLKQQFRNNFIMYLRNLTLKNLFQRLEERAQIDSKPLK